MNYTLNRFRERRLKTGYLLTTDSGSNIFLSEPEHESLKKKEIDSNLYSKLKNVFILLDDTNKKEYLAALVKRYSYLRSPTSLHIIIPTLRCDMSCLYCHASSKNSVSSGYDMDLDTAKKVVDFILSVPRQELTIEFQGGEPLLNWDIIKFVIGYSKEGSKKLHKTVQFSIVTNLNSMDEEKMRYLIDNSINVCTSLDGPKILHEKNRKNNLSNFDKLSYWIKKFEQEYRERKIINHLNALPTITRHSLNFSKEIIDEYISLSLPSIHIRSLNYLGAARNNCQDIGYRAEEFIEFWKNCLGYIDQKRKEGKKISERMAAIIESKISNRWEYDFLDLRSPCGAVIGQMAYNYNGDIYSCDEARMLSDDLFKLGNVREDSYEKIIKSKKSCLITNSSINDQYCCDDCAYQPYCGICPVCNYAEQGNIVAKIPLTTKCKIAKAQFDYMFIKKFINS